MSVIKYFKGNRQASLLISNACSLFFTLIIAYFQQWQAADLALSVWIANFVVGMVLLPIILLVWMPREAIYRVKSLTGKSPSLLACSIPSIIITIPILWLYFLLNAGAPLLISMILPTSDAYSDVFGFCSHNFTVLLLQDMAVDCNKILSLMMVSIVEYYPFIIIFAFQILMMVRSHKLESHVDKSYTFILHFAVYNWCFLFALMILNLIAYYGFDVQSNSYLVYILIIFYFIFHEVLEQKSAG